MGCFPQALLVAIRDATDRAVGDPSPPPPAAPASRPPGGRRGRDGASVGTRQQPQRFVSPAIAGSLITLAALPVTSPIPHTLLGTTDARWGFARVRTAALGERCVCLISEPLPQNQLKKEEENVHRV